MRLVNSSPRIGRHIAALVLALGSLGLPMAASAFWNHDWSFRKQIIIDPAGSSIALKQDIADVPVLVRLHEGVFKFADANPDGSDLRFVADDDKTPLKFHIEKYDSVFNLAYIWVSLPKIHAGDKTTIWLYYGNSRATSASSARETYDPDQVLVYHFAERGVPALDSSGYANNSPSTAAADEAGLIGTAAKFTGAAPLMIPATASLAVAEAGTSTISLWVKPAAAGADAVLYARHDGANALIIGLDKGAPYLSITSSAGTKRSAPTVPLGDKAWHDLAVVTGARATLYVDGAVGADMDLTMPPMSSVATLGGDSDGAANFIGEIDEFEVAKVARDPGYLQLQAVNQSASGKLLEFGADEQLSSWSSGYIGIILHSVTLDGWVVIGILLVMAVVSWVVMVAKIRQVQRAAAANRAFATLQRNVGGDLHAVNQQVAGLALGVSEGKRLLVQDAPLFRMFSAGINELRQRVASEHGGAPQKNGDISAQSIAAIRAVLDSCLVDELDALDDRMVVLTVAISGGPFLGLLGTVVGVMITFAAIAASGDVNVNSIAPGIAAALVATVAGLAVAIPALFGYNYLTTRIRRMTAQMQVYIDTFITRMGESYQRSTETVAAPAAAGAVPTRRDPAQA